MAADSQQCAYFTRYDSVKPFITKDGSIIRELLHPSSHGNKDQSLAEAIVKPGDATINHYHKVSDEVYHVTDGEGIINRGGEAIKVIKGDTVFVPPGIEQNIVNTGSTDLKILCFLTPPYSHEQTVIVEDNK